MSPSRFLSVVSAAGLGALALVAPSSSAVSPGVFMSPNVTWVATIPLDAPAISGRVLTVGGQRRFYAVGSKGLTIYDITDPAAPVPLGALANPHFENESAAISDDGGTVFLTSDPAFEQPPVTYIVDTSLVVAPHVVGVILEGTHTATCGDPTCHYLYANYGWIYDVHDRANPLLAGHFDGFRHYGTRDASGKIWSDDKVFDPTSDPLHPSVTTVGTGGWHDNVHTGNLVIGTDETWLEPGTCTDASGALSTWNVTSTPATKLDTVRPVNGDYRTDGNPVVDPIGCSGHWFDYRDSVVAAAWYDHGV
jgi:hypothetical protein